MRRAHLHPCKKESPQAHCKQLSRTPTHTGGNAGTEASICIMVLRDQADLLKEGQAQALD